MGRSLRIKPVRNLIGRVCEPAAVLLVPVEAIDSVSAGIARLPIPGPLLGRASAGDVLRIADLRGGRRKLRLVGRQGDGWLAHGERTLYVGQGAACELKRGGAPVAEATVGGLPSVVTPILLEAGDRLVLTRGHTARSLALEDDGGRTVSPARIPCSLPAAFERVKPGERVWLDDGRFGGVVRTNDGLATELDITRAPPGGGTLREEKGINLPDSQLGLDALTDRDMSDLRVVAEFADIVALSFASTPQDVVALRGALHALGADGSV